MYYVYKIHSNLFDDYYVGITSQFIKRMATHSKQIRGLIKYYLQAGTRWKIKKPKVFHPIHEIIAKKAAEEYKGINYDPVGIYYRVTVLHKGEDATVAKNIESSFLSTGDKNCTNVQKESRYVPRQKKAKA
jgi:hypothetical protein